ncbi:MAG: flagellar hook-associated protein FlgK [Rhodocyclales bacterium]|nr:flagellar hook-associated protein FlgK [Rhodocyclales bacterium]
MNVFSISVSGLNAAQAGMLTTSHNISNVSTPGYSRQEIVQSANIPQFTGSGYFGQGTQVATVKRIYDQFLGSQVLSAEAGAAEMNSYQAQISQISNLLADPSSGLAPALSGFFKAVQDVAANPASIAGRQSMLSAAQALAAQFQALDQRFSEIRDGTNQQISGQIAQINTYSSQLADINQRILLAQANGSTQLPNDLLDQRDQMVKELNKLVRVSTLNQGDGSISIFIGNGQPLVVGTQAYQMKAVPATDDPQRTTVAMLGVGGTALTLPESQITGGSLGGLLNFRSQSLDAAQNAVGRIALTLAQNFNDQHKLGQDLTGALGTNLFNVSAPSVLSSSLNTGTGAPAVSIDSTTVAQLTASDYQLTYLGVGSYRLTRLADNSIRNYAALPQTVDGMTIAAGTWAPNANDNILIQPTRTGARNISVAFSDGRQIAAAAPIRTGTPLTNTGTATIDSGSVSSTASLPLAGTVTLTYSTATSQFMVTGPIAAGPIAYVSGQSISFGGMTVSISGNPANGDTFTISRNLNGVADNRNVALLGALQTSNTMQAGSASYGAAYSQIVSAVGSKDNEVQAIGAAQQGLADNATKSLQSLAGVNLDEEAANLMRYQQAYQASAKVLATASKLFDAIIALG